MSTRTFVGVAISVICMATSAYAVPITPSPTIISGNETFNNFTSCNVVGGVSLTCAQIDVSAHTSLRVLEAQTWVGLPAPLDKVELRRRMMTKRLGTLIVPLTIDGRTTLETIKL